MTENSERTCEITTMLLHSHPLEYQLISLSTVLREFTHSASEVNYATESAPSCHPPMVTQRSLNSIYLIAILSVKRICACHTIVLWMVDICSTGTECSRYKKWPVFIALTF